VSYQPPARGVAQASRTPQLFHLAEIVQHRPGDQPVTVEPGVVSQQQLR
jgi:hypothetical protein